MIIEHKFKNNSVRFGSLEIGDCFQTLGDVYVKMWPISTYDADGETVYNAFCFSDSHAIHVWDEDMVIPVEIKLVEA